MRINKFLIVGILVFLGSTLFLSFVSAEFWACFEKGEIAHYCNNYKPDWTCGTNNGCEKCMSVYRENETCYIHGSWPKCSQLPPGCSNFGNGSIDTQAPNLIIYSPAQDEVYTERSVMLDLEVNEEADIYYYDNIVNRGIWTRVCTDCLGYSRTRSFSEGLNNLTFKATDAIGNEAYLTRSFFVDSKKPKIKKTEPKKGFSDGNFYVEIQEANPTSLVLHYGDTNPGMRTANVDLETCEDIKGNSEKKACYINVPLIDYDGKQIEYWFDLTDISGNNDTSKHLILDVDTTYPFINYFNYVIDGRYVSFNMNIIENNFDEVSYTYIDSRGMLRERNLCSRLRDGWCTKKVSFSRGHYDLTIQVKDEAGNSIGFPVSFDINY